MVKNISVRITRRQKDDKIKIVIPSDVSSSKLKIVIHFIGTDNHLPKKTSKTSHEAFMVKMHFFDFDDIHLYIYIYMYFFFLERKPI